MPWFKCSIEGRDFPGVLMQQDGPLGFFATRVVEAASAEAAAPKALEKLRADPTFRLPEGVVPSEAARVVLESITEIDASQAKSIANSGASWFPMNEAD